MVAFCDVLKKVNSCCRNKMCRTTLGKILFPPSDSGWELANKKDSWVWVGRTRHRIRKWKGLLYMLNQDPVSLSKHSAKRKCRFFYSCVFWGNICHELHLVYVQKLFCLWCYSESWMCYQEEELTQNTLQGILFSLGHELLVSNLDYY